MQIDGTGREYLSGVLHRLTLGQVHDLDQLQRGGNPRHIQRQAQSAVGLHQPRTHMRSRERDRDLVVDQDVEHQDTAPGLDVPGEAVVADLSSGEDPTPVTKPRRRRRASAPAGPPVTHDDVAREAGANRPV